MIIKASMQQAFAGSLQAAAMVAAFSMAAGPTLALAQTPASPEATPERPKTLGGKPSVCINGKPCELQELVVMVARMTNKRFIMSEKMKGEKIYIHGLSSNEYMSPNQAYQLFLSTLEAMGITVVRSGGYYKLIEAKEAPKAPIPTCFDGDQDCIQYSERMITALIQLENLGVQDVQAVIKSLLSKDALISVFPASNSLIVSEFAPNLTRIRKILEKLDEPGFNDELRIVQIVHATAQEVADTLNETFEVGGSSGGARGSARSPRSASAAKASTESNDPDTVQISKIIADERTNQLIIKADKRSFAAIKRIIDAIDVDLTDPGNESVHVYELEYADAEQLASTLSNLAQDTGGARPNARAAARRAGPEAETGATGAALFADTVRITADTQNNALIIMGSGRDYRSLVKLIEKLDRPRKQVYVEAAIMEVSLENGTDFGLGWHAPMQFAEGDLPGDLGGGGTFGYSQSIPATDGGSPPSTLVPVTSPEGLLAAASGSMVGIIGKTLSLPVGDSTIDIPSFGIVLRWLETFAQTNILSTPHILTTDNEEAEIEVGQRIAFLAGGVPQQNISNLLQNTDTGSAALLGGLGGAFNQQIRREDVSLKLKLTPHVNASGKIRLEIDQQIEDIIEGRSVNGQPSTSKRKAKTVVVVDDQQTVVIGGLMRERAGRNETKVPILGDIPILGALFKQTRKTSEKVNLLLVLTPYVIEDAADYQRIFERKMDEYQEFGSAYYGHMKEYRAHIDYQKKAGPIAKLGREVSTEMRKIENGGPGDGEILIDAPTEPELVDPLEDPMEGEGVAPTEDESEAGAEGDTPSAPPADTTGSLPEPSSPEPVRLLDEGTSP